MSIEAALPKHWKATAALAALVGDRIFPTAAPQNNAPLPYITWQRTGSTPVYHFTGRSNLIDYAVQLDVFARDSVEAQQIDAAVVAACDAKYQGALADGIDIRRMSIMNSLDNPESPDDGGQFGPWHRVIEVRVWYRVF